jgi:outer membrane protein OmpA-like peptidoglycan-associated protein
MSYCGNCGTKLTEGHDFCPECGAKVRGGTESAAISEPEPVTPSAATPMAVSPGPTSSGNATESETSLQKLASLRTQAQTAEKKSGSKILVSILLFILLAGAAAIGGGVYLAYRVKQKATAVLDKLETGGGKNHKANPNDVKPNDSGDDRSSKNADQNNTQDGKQRSGDDPNVSKGLDAISGLMDKMGFGDPPPNPYQELPVLQPDDLHKNFCDPDHEAKDLPDSSTPIVGNSGIPMKKGLLLVKAWGRKFGDSEGIDSVSRITNKYVEIADSGPYFTSPDAEKGNPDSAVREVCSNDLQEAHGLATGFSDYGPITLPGSTTIDISHELFRTLKERGKIDFRYLEYVRAGGLGTGGYLHWERGVLTRVEPGGVSMPVIVNGTPMKLPAIHAAGTVVVESKKAQELSKDPNNQPLATDLYVLDDPANPLVLLFKENVNNFRMQVTEIRFPLPTPEKKIEHELSKNKKALVYGIYFDYNSDEIRKESEPVLKEIAQALTDKPEWKLTIAGHTDNIGGHKYNLELSQRRSASVKKALVERYHIDPNRLSTTGSGDYAPVDTNDTLEGRARNRRVELTLD